MDIATNVKELLGKRLLVRLGDEDGTYYKEIRLAELAGNDKYVFVLERKDDEDFRAGFDTGWMTKERFLRRFEIVEYLRDKAI